MPEGNWASSIKRLSTVLDMLRKYVVKHVLWHEENAINKF